MDERLKRLIIDIAIESGCDPCGDLIWYGGECYYVHIYNDEVYEK